MYTVTWTPAAVSELAEVWLTADSALRRQLTSAINEIDSSLRRSPDVLGESRSHEGLRVVIAWPILIEFCVFPEDQRVDITRVVRVTRGKGN